MALTPEQFFSKNLKWITLILLFLFLFKSMQSCNRNTMLSMSQQQYIDIIDSLENKFNKLEKESQDSIKKLNFQLTLEKEKASSADKRAEAVQNAVEKTRYNTTTNIVVKGAEEVKDTTKKKK